MLGCLARLDLETVLAGKDSLDAVRRSHTERALRQNAGLLGEVALLEQARALLETQINQVQDRLVEAAAREGGAEARAVELAERLAHMTAESAELGERGAQLHQAIEEARRRIAELEAEAAAARARTGELETSAVLLAQERDEKERLLAGMVRTRVWRAAQTWWAVKRVVARPWRR